jgi:catechol 2,3-dioxygenase-like lactoylglutathione lyase family enzyme
MDKPQLKLSQIGVVMLGVKDLARSVAFYRDRLGLTLRQETPGFAFFAAGGVTLCLSQPLAKASGKGPGDTEVVFSVEDVQAAYEGLRERRVEFTQEPRNVTQNLWAASFTDPDGHRLSIFGPERKL